MEIVQVAGIVFAAAVIVILAYLYRESAIIEGKAEWGIGPWKFKLGGKAQKQADAPEEKPAAPPMPKIEQSAEDLGRITRSGPEQGEAGEIKQTASGGDVTEDSTQVS
jgi:hypothetical protein